MSILPTEFVID